MRRRRNHTITNDGGFLVMRVKETYKRRKRRIQPVVKCICLTLSLYLTASLIFVRHHNVNSLKKRSPRNVTYDGNMNVTSVSSFHFKSQVEEEGKICEPLVPWQEITNVNCNIIHELDLIDMNVKLVNQGFIREVWQVFDMVKDRHALKTLLYDEEFSTSTMEGQALDAKISDQLVASPNIVNIYGYCGFSGLYDFSSEGSLEDHYKSYNKIDRFRIAIDVTKGLVDLHDLGDKGQSAVIHNDIGIRQFVFLGDRYCLNDFNTARFLYWNPKDNVICPDVTPSFSEKNRSPEEMRYEINYVDEKIDVYSLGNIFYKLIMNERKYDELDTETSREMILSGHIPKIEVTHEVDLILEHAMIMCLQLDPAERSSAKEVYHYLVNELEKMNA